MQRASNSRKSATVPNKFTSKIHRMRLLTLQLGFGICLALQGCVWSENIYIHQHASGGIETTRQTRASSFQDSNQNSFSFRLQPMPHTAMRFTEIELVISGSVNMSADDLAKIKQSIRKEASKRDSGLSIEGSLNQNATADKETSATTLQMLIGKMEINGSVSDLGVNTDPSTQREFSAKKLTVTAKWPEGLKLCANESSVSFCLKELKVTYPETSNFYVTLVP